MPEAEKKETRGVERHGMAWWVWVVLILLLAYPLSVGPAVKFYGAEGPGARKVLTVLYAPLEFLCEHIDPVETFMSWYVDRVWHGWDEELTKPPPGGSP